MMNNFFLCNSHLEQLKASAISLEIATERGYRTVTDKVELTSLGFVRTQLRVPGLLIPQWRVEGMQKDYQLRPGSPRSNKKGKVIKLANPSILLWISEGSKKADALASQGTCALSLAGVWGFKGKNEFGAVTMLSDWNYIALKDRFVYLAFDSDMENKKEGKEALQRLAQHLKNKGAIVQILRLPSSDGVKTGIDDYLAAGHNLTDTEKLTEPYEPETEEHKINCPYAYHDNSLYLQIRRFDGDMAFAFLSRDQIKLTQEISIGKERVVIPQSLPKGEDGGTNGS
jgi:hypothetical protein